MKAEKRITAEPKNQRGFTIGELLVAMAIIMTCLIFTLSLIQTGMGRISDMRLNTKIRECARLTMEYYNSIPPDQVWNTSKQAPLTGDFVAGGGNTDMVNFVNDQNNSCRELSDTGNPLGSRVHLTWTICPGCITYMAAATTLSTCIYNLKVRLNYNNLYYGGPDHIDYQSETFTGQSGDCDDAINPAGCGQGSDPETKRLCNFN